MIVIGVLFVIGLLVFVVFAFWVVMTAPGDDNTEKQTRKKGVEKMKEKTIPAWKSQTLMCRALDCATFLLVHNFITPLEREKIHLRMLKAAGKKSDSTKKVNK